MKRKKMVIKLDPEKFSYLITYDGMIYHIHQILDDRDIVIYRKKGDKNVQ